MLDSPLKILNLEDNKVDTELIRLELENEGIAADVTAVEDRDDFEQLLRQQRFDLIISDFTLPAYDGKAALTLAQQISPDTPFIFFSGTIGEEAAVESLTSGAVDYVLKNKPERLIPAIMRALRYREQREKLRRAEIELNEKAELFSAVFETINEGIFLADLDDYKLFKVNPAFCRILKYNREEALRLKLRDVFSSTYNSLIKNFSYVLENERHSLGEQLAVDSAGKEVAVNVAFSVIAYRGKSAICGVLRDISNEKKALVLIRENEQRFKALVDASFDGVFIHIDEKIVSANKAMTGITGYALSELISAPVSLLAPPRDVEKARTHMKTNLAKPYEITAVRKNGEEYPVELVAQNCRYNGKDARVVAIRDLSERRKAEQQIRNSERKFRRLFERSQDGIVLFDERGHVVDANKMAMEYLRRDSDTAQLTLAKNLFEKPEEAEAFIKELKEKKALSNTEISVRYASEETKYYMLSASLVEKQGDEKQLYQLELRNITREKYLQAQLLQSQKMEAMGVLAGGIAHDFNNILSIIMGYAELAMQQSSSNKMAIREILTASVRARDLVTQILTFSRQAERQISTIRMKLIVKEVVKFLRASIPAHITIGYNYNNEDLLLVKGDPTQLHSVLMNLCTNAYHAIGEKKGRIDVSVREVTVSADNVLKDGKYALLEVSDDGCGIDPTKLRKIFDPFYTTKPVGKGTGMGLSMVHGIVKDHHGDVRVKSNPGKGTVFSVYFPVHEPAEESEQHSDDAGELYAGQANILLVDDEQAIARVSKELLELTGHRVIYKNSPGDALKLFENHPNDFDMLITDLSMPNMDGYELALSVKSIRPEMPVIVMTGFEDEKKVKLLKEEGLVNLIIRKPFQIKEFSKQIKDLLVPGSKK